MIFLIDWKQFKKYLMTLDISFHDFSIKNPPVPQLIPPSQIIVEPVFDSDLRHNFCCSSAVRKNWKTISTKNESRDP